MGIRIRDLRALMVAAACSLVAAAPLMSSGPATSAPKRGGTITMALEADFPSLDPIRVSALVERQVAMAIMDPLFDLSEDGQLVPVLAKGYEALEDGRIYRISLRDGVKFHDGTPLNAEAVVFNIERLRNPKNACRCLPLLSDILEVKAVDALTVDFVMKGPNAVLPTVLADAPGLILSPTAIAANEKAVASRPVGTGPFILSEWKAGFRNVLERNPNYWRAGKPHLDRVVFVPLSNEESRQSSLLSGVVDVVQSPSAKFVRDMRENKRYKIMTGAGLGSLFLMMNTRTPPFDDVRVRQAIAHATDRRLIVKAIYHDQYPLADSLIAPGSWAYSKATKPLDHDVAKAKALLAEHGKPVSFTLTTTPSPLNNLMAQALQEMWAEVGIKAEIKPVEQARFIRDAISHQFQMSYFRWAGRPDPDLSLFRAFHSSLADKPSSNYTQYANPKLDALLEKGRVTIDRDARKKIYHEATDILASDLPYFYIYFATFHSVMNAKVHPGPNIPDGVLRLVDAWVE